MHRSILHRHWHKIIASILLVAILGTSGPLPGLAWAFATNSAQAESLDARPSDPLAAAHNYLAEAGLSLPDGQFAETQLNTAPAAPIVLEPAAVSRNPISVSRVQSAYTAADVISNTLVVTFTITNNQPPALIPEVAPNATFTDTVTAMQAVDAQIDPNTIFDVLLVNELTGTADFASASTRPDRDGAQYAWNLGHIPPLESLTVAMHLTIPDGLDDFIALDGGATAWGTTGGRPVQAQTCPTTLAPNAMSPYLQNSVDANLADEYVLAQNGDLCHSPAATFEYVRTFGYEAYKGSLRGARGTLWSQAGNSLDQSNLLIALLRGGGTPARYRRGTLSTERAQELILSMFPAAGAVVGYVPEGAEVSDPANDPQLLAEAQDHWWVEAYVDGGWVAMDPSFKYAAPGDTFTSSNGELLDTVPDELRHKVTVTIEIERYDMLTYLYRGFEYETPLIYTFNTAELVGEPLTLEHLIATEKPPLGCLIFCWTRYTYVPYLRLGDNEWVVEGHPFWELLSDYPFGQFANSAAWLHLDVRDAEGNTTRYTRSIADRVGGGPRQGPLREPKKIQGLMNADVLSSLGPGTPSLVHDLDSHTIYFNPSWMAEAYAAEQTGALLAAAKRVPATLETVEGLNRMSVAAQHEAKQEMLALALDATTAFNRTLGASFVTFSDAASQDLAATGLVRAYAASPRITIASTVNLQEGDDLEQAQVLDLLHNSLRTIAYPGQARGAEQVYQMTRGVNETFLETSVGETLTGQRSASAANILQAAAEQEISLVYVDAENLNGLAKVEISAPALAYVMDAVENGYGIFVPERMVDFDGSAHIAWWQIDLATGEMIGVGEDGPHQFLVIFTEEAKLFARIVQFTQQLIERLLRQISIRFRVWQGASTLAWQHFWLNVAGGDPSDPQEVYEKTLKDTKDYMDTTGWDQFVQAWNDNPLLKWIPPDWVR